MSKISVYLCPVTKHVDININICHWTAILMVIMMGGNNNLEHSEANNVHHGYKDIPPQSEQVQSNSRPLTFDVSLKDGRMADPTTFRTVTGSILATRSTVIIQDSSRTTALSTNAILSHLSLNPSESLTVITSTVGLTAPSNEANAQNQAASKSRSPFIYVIFSVLLSFALLATLVLFIVTVAVVFISVGVGVVGVHHTYCTISTVSSALWHVTTGWVQAYVLLITIYEPGKFQVQRGGVVHHSHVVMCRLWLRAVELQKPAVFEPSLAPAVIGLRILKALGWG
ncbi:hypothetical protein BDP27DRAFT_1373747 [Rhodocollybia butyracea]|uniref:Uncharacterized protein n=1 Tax=Rhodocollybia butyracea TaxID=206335 RepID=A0A9P5P8G8_9AGAR|nr:hypothetical protein BDP27DRAFT_1373747 [Rhodocollybia butyracea]